MRTSRSRWALKNPDRPVNPFAQLILKGSLTPAPKATCLHTSRRWRGGFNWDCTLCGEAVLDREEKTQTTFSSTIYTEA